MKSIVVGSFEAKNRLSELLEYVSKGQEVLITRRNKPIARLVQEPQQGTNDGKAAQPDWLEMSRRIRQEAVAGKESIKELIEAGRE